MSATDTINTMFDAAIDAERYQEDLYAAFEALFSHHPEVAAFWKGMQEDERRHAAALERVRAKIQWDQINAPADTDLLAQTRALTAVPIETRIRTIESLNDAYEMAHELEDSEFNALFDFIIDRFSDSEEALAFAHGEIERHLAKLIEFPSTLGGYSWRKSILASRGDHA